MNWLFFYVAAVAAHTWAADALSHEPLKIRFSIKNIHSHVLIPTHSRAMCFTFFLPLAAVPSGDPESDRNVSINKLRPSRSVFISFNFCAPLLFSFVNLTYEVSFAYSNMWIRSEKSAPGDCGDRGDQPERAKESGSGWIELNLRFTIKGRAISMTSGSNLLLVQNIRL